MKEYLQENYSLTSITFFYRVPRGIVTSCFFNKLTLRNRTTKEQLRFKLVKPINDTEPRETGHKRKVLPDAPEGNSAESEEPAQKKNATFAW